MNFFTNNAVKNTITSFNGSNFKHLQGFGMMCDFNTSYYIIDLTTDTIFASNDNYGYITNKSFSEPAFMIAINARVYITGAENIWKTDKYLNVLQTYNESGNYRGIYFNSTENLIYVASKSYEYIQVFDLNLTNKYIVNLPPSYKARSFGEYNNELYVGTYNSIVLVVVNKAIIRNFTACVGFISISSIVFDNYGFMGISCQKDNQNNSVELYYFNGTFAGQKFTTPERTVFFGLDSKKRFVIISQKEISIYY
jgi:hypothetical protein